MISWRFRVVKAVEKIVKRASEALYSEEFKKKHRMKEEYFTRNRKLGFREICLAVIKGSKSGLYAGLKAFRTEIHSDVDSYSKAAFCKARQKINPEAFREIFQLSATEFYETMEYNTYRGYRMCAIDGSKVNLPNTEELLTLYDSQPYGQGTQQAQTRVSCLYDVLNHVVLDADMNPCDSDERKLALTHFERLSGMRTEKELLLLDRGYPSEELLLHLERHGFRYVIRANKKNFFREVRDVTGSDKTVVRTCEDNTKLKIRVIQFELSTGEMETLLTNIFDSDYSVADFGAIYHLRWGIERYYDILKNKLLLEKFTGISDLCIRQDFFASLFLANLLACVEADCEEPVQKRNQEKTGKYCHQINTTLAVSELKSHIVELIVTESPRKRRKLLRQIQDELMHNLLPVRPGRSFPHKTKHPAVKFPQNRKLF